MNWENEELPIIKNLYESSDPLEIKPGTIWLLPVYFFLEFPPHILNYGESDSFYISEEVKVERTNSYWCEDKKYFNPKRKSWVALEAKVRPFLVMQKPMVAKEGEKYFISWQGNSVAGLPITSLYHLENENIKIDPGILERDNNYPYHYFIPNDKTTRIKKKSYVVITTLTRIHRSYFTHPLGKLPEEKVSEIIKKFKNYI